MEREYPHLYGDMERHLEWCRVVTHEGRIVSHVGVYPLPFVSYGRRIPAGGIGAVATEPAYRGQGLMAALLDHATGYMRHHGLPLSILWGDRTRYARFGWEPAGRALSFAVNRRCAEALKAHDAPVAELRDPARASDVLLALHRINPVRVDRDESMMTCITAKIGRRTVVARRGRTVIGYAIVRRWSGTDGATWNLEELGGSAHGVLSLIRWFAARPGVARVRGTAPVEGVRWLPELQSAIDHWGSSVQWLGQIKVTDRPALMLAHGLPALESRLARLRLDANAAARLLYGPLPPGAHLPARAAASYAGRLPLPLFMWNTDHV
jgi:GNAT superfamily N-acetyltransferase